MRVVYMLLGRMHRAKVSHRRAFWAFVFPVSYVPAAPTSTSYTCLQPLQVVSDASRYVDVLDVSR